LAPEIGAFDPVESYDQAADGTINVTYEYRKGGFSAEKEIKKMIAEIKPDTGGAEWGVRLLGPLTAQYVIAHVEEDYSAAIVARDARDHVWILARSAPLPDEQLKRYRSKIADMGYDLGKLVLFPQSYRAT
jgi:apolipoprotein D and lipocalin family protein